MLDIVTANAISGLDSETWCRCRLACKAIEAIAMKHCNRDTKLYRDKILMNRKLDEAANAASQMISAEPWSFINRRCCSAHCNNEANSMTGVWIPEHVMWIRQSPEHRWTTQNEWWRNMPSARNYYPTSSPQVQVTQMMQEQKCRNPETKNLYVACSERCLHHVLPALKTKYWRNPKMFYVLLGVDKVEQQHDPRYFVDISPSDSSDSDVTLSLDWISALARYAVQTWPTMQCYTACLPHTFSCSVIKLQTIRSAASSDNNQLQTQAWHEMRATVLYGLLR